jgi:hypothetical protein
MVPCKKKKLLRTKYLVAGSRASGATAHATHGALQKKKMREQNTLWQAAEQVAVQHMLQIADCGELCTGHTNLY